MAVDTCVECRERDAALNVRNRRLCAACFSHYVHSKILKRMMESYRMKKSSANQKDRLFLPLSGGTSSLVLLQVLDAQLQKQIANRNRTSYDIVVARVVLPEEHDSAAIKNDYEDLKQRFSTHTFLPLLSMHDVLRLDSKIDQDMRHLGIVRRDEESDGDFFVRIVSCTTSATTRSDLQSILLKRLLVAVARDQKCTSVLWGHSDTRLAALALADVAKGRGGSVSSTIADGQSMHGINFSHPLRDLFKAELQAYAQMTSEYILERAVGNDSPPQKAASIRTTSIDNLLNTYITSQSEKYQSIVANVVRTASKLEVKRPNDTVISCPVCIMPVVEAPGTLISDSGLCYGCERMKHDVRP
ncbi:Cytoplasmic tRNA 2-thiolation protein 2 [Exophiala xenobiotica]|uniref:Cytoplasmic tRNA 2-thiolation protein 2 n=1 Tax=Vermiconidia calcicola TaxID=1690605 RepID=A0AAV9QBJ6_9PEZI|nr:Cytoplasmic tRNA 2-thiolation protein 2 [Exophiala xenobiotica]KAK5531690.1 Cytoplasmic tRNA 2-thiolation protein 2 [Chaetothyriales sp. CCFEE 6169]KAK5539984.1 Cytoplasmic tRNA 2-thiolation protein 2 [Vermiconidia calcicola]KAK5304247.1 Cytoplasmic tRNA 2-thiolation protein 2 [Exophiala xenobiotica]KAK5338856.1 Cytoplasmic tRNA 2-thiolation protein 2 [Exophiala xenobiotica]